MLSCLSAEGAELTDRAWLASSHSARTCASSCCCSASPSGCSRLSAWRADICKGRSRSLGFRRFLQGRGRVQIAHRLLHARTRPLPVQPPSHVSRRFAMGAGFLRTSVCLCSCSLLTYLVACFFALP